MNPIYKFQLSAGNDTRQAFPIYKDDLAIEYALEQNQEFYRGKLSGKLTFQKDDYLFIRNKAFDTQFDIVISISYDGGQTWADYWSGQFWKTDCAFNEDDQTAIVTPNVNDRYSVILAGMDKEYNLIDLAPEIVPVKADKRPMVQVYVPGQTVIGCFLSGMWWEQECEAVADETKLVNDYYFVRSKSLFVVDVSGGGSISLPQIFTGDSFDPTKIGTQDYTNKGYTFRYANYAQPDGGGFNITWSIIRNSDSKTLWSKTMGSGVHPQLPYQMVLNPVSGSGATGNVTLYLHTISVYSRLICDTQTIVTGSLTYNTYEIPANDIVENNRNYTRVIGYNFPDTIVFSTTLVATPTKWGIYQPGQYYFNPADNALLGLGEAFPVARNAWGLVSIWFVFSAVDWLAESSARRTFTIRDAYPIWSVISVLLAKVAPGITHDKTTDYSQFLYDDTNPIIGIKQRLFITPKSNLVTAGYDQPAQKAPITLKRITDMLRDCFRCYWFIDEQNRFHIEHISYFMRGGTYMGQPVVGIDLTKQIVTRNGKPWAFARNQYEFDKPEMAARYQFGWMDDVTELFNGYPIDIISKYVKPDNIEQIDVSQFTSDVDYILLNPGEISKDGFVLLAGTNENYLEEPITKSGTPTSGIIFNEIDLRQSLGQTITINIQSTAGNTKIAQSNAIAELEEIGTIEQANTIYSFTFKVTQMFIIMYNSATNFTGTLNAIYGITYKLPYVNFDFDGTDHILQNAWASFMFLQWYYMFDMPTRNVQINGVTQIVQGIKKLKTQTIKFPVLKEPDMFSLIKTELGNGTIQKMSVNLSSRNAKTTLKYDTE
jgi:hypothetical protein